LSELRSIQSLGKKRRMEQTERTEMTSQEQIHESGSGSAGGFLAGLVVGGLAGAGTALLLAPESGKRTRSGIKRKGAALRDRTVETMGNTMADVRVKARQISAPAVRQAKEMRQRGQLILEEQRDRLTHGPCQPSQAVALEGV
jgi:gas vesicle protein